MGSFFAGVALVGPSPSGDNWFFSGVCSLIYLLRISVCVLALDVCVLSSGFIRIISPLIDELLSMDDKPRVLELLDALEKVVRDADSQRSTKVATAEPLFLFPFLFSFFLFFFFSELSRVRHLATVL